MVDTNDEWITTVQESKKEEFKGEGLASSDLGAKAVQGLLAKKGMEEEIDLIICATATPI